jgi:hypothetical protein
MAAWFMLGILVVLKQVDQNKPIPSSCNSSGSACGGRRIVLLYSIVFLPLARFKTANNLLPTWKAVFFRHEIVLWIDLAYRNYFV